METVKMIYEGLAGLMNAAGLPMPTGDRVFVQYTNGTDAATHGDTPEEPVKTLAYAVGKCLANTGNLIILMPGHAETVDAIADINVNCAGITVVALGNGANRATFTFNTVVGASITFAQPNVTFARVKFLNSVDAATGPLDVTAADVSFLDCEFEDDGNQNTLTWIKQGNSAHRLLVKDCINFGTTQDGNDNFIELGSARGTRILNLISRGDFADANIKFTAAALDFLVEDAKLTNNNTTSNKNVAGIAAMSGDFNNCRCRIDTDGALTWIDTPADSSLYECYGVNQPSEAGILIGTPSS